MWSSRSSSSTPAAAASTASSKDARPRRPSAEVAGPVRQPVDAPGEHVVHGGGGVGLGDQRAQVATVVGEAGVLDQEERVAVGAVGAAGRPAASVGITSATASTTSAA